MSKKILVVALSLLGAAGCSRAPKQQPAQTVSTQAQPVAGAGQANPEPVVTGQAAAETFLIPAGTDVRVRLDQTLGTKYDHAGHPFQATLDSPIAVDGRVVVPTGTPFRGRVVVAKKSGRLRGRAVIELTLVSFQLNGATYSIVTGPKMRTSKSHRGRNLALIGGGGGVGAAIGAIAHGGAGALIGGGAGAAAGATAAFVTGRKNVTLPAETPLLFSLRDQVEVRG
jgi:hypothetical protein